MYPSGTPNPKAPLKRSTLKRTVLPYLTNGPMPIITPVYAPKLISAPFYIVISSLKKIKKIRTMSVQTAL